MSRMHQDLHLPSQALTLLGSCAGADSTQPEEAGAAKGASAPGDGQDGSRAVGPATELSHSGQAVGRQAPA